MGFRMLPSAAALAVVMLLAGCVPGEPVVTPEPDPDVTPVFASDEEALAAATDAYTKYLEVSDQIFADGGDDADRLRAVLTGDKLRAELSSFAEFRANGYRGTGQTSFDGATLQAHDPSALNGERIVVIYVCDDLSATDVLDAAGKSIVSEARPSRIKYEVAFDLDSAESKLLLVSSKEKWSEQQC